MVAVKETGELLDLVLTLVKVGGEVAADGKVSMLEMAKLLEILPKVGPAVEGAGGVPAELKDMDEAEKQALFAKVAALDIPQDAVEEWVERGLKAGLVLGALIADYVVAKAAKPSVVA